MAMRAVSTRRTSQTPDSWQLERAPRRHLARHRAGHQVGRPSDRTAKGGRLLVVDVDFMVSDTRMKVIQHITHHEDSDTLRARYMDTMGDEATYDVACSSTVRGRRPD